MLKEMKVAPMALEKQQDVRVTATLISQLKKQIASGLLSPGDKFPSERDLSKTFKVNRASMRQALKVLEMMGVLTQRIGDGTYLSNNTEFLLSEPMDFLVLLDTLSEQDLLETRLLVEPTLAARAAERATAEDLAALRSALASLEKSKTQRERTQADYEYHDAIFRAAGNRICHLLLRNIQRITHTGNNIKSKSLSLESSVKFYRRTYSAIRARDAKEASDATREHLLEALANETSG